MSKARPSFTEQLYDSEEGYSRLARYVLDCLVNRGALREEKHHGQDFAYWRTDRLKALCPEIMRVMLPVIDRIVDEYDRQHQQYD